MNTQATTKKVFFFFLIGAFAFFAYGVATAQASITYTQSSYSQSGNKGTYGNWVELIPYGTSGSFRYMGVIIDRTPTTNISSFKLFPELSFPV